MIDPYSVVGLSPRTFTIDRPEQTLENLGRIGSFMDDAVMVAATEGAPVRLVVLPEMAIQGMPMTFAAGNQESHDKFAVTIPGPETDALAEKARQLDTYIAAELLFVRYDDFPDHLFNVAFIVDPDGDIVYQRAKSTSDAFEGGALGTTNPHDVWDEWIEKRGNGNVLDAIFPVAKTEIGNIGYAICHEGAYPETSRGLAMNGAEILIRATLIEPQVFYGMWEVQNRSHAIANQMMVIAPNLGPEILSDGTHRDLFAGQSMIVDHRGQIVAKQAGMANGDSFVSTVIDIEALRRARILNGVTNFLKDLRTEQYAAIYDQPIYPKNQYLHDPPSEGWLDREAKTRAKNIDELVRRGVLTPPSGD